VTGIKRLRSWNDFCILTTLRGLFWLVCIRCFGELDGTGGKYFKAYHVILEIQETGMLAGKKEINAYCIYFHTKNYTFIK
jgi:hypothetical protein